MLLPNHENRKNRAKLLQNRLKGKDFDAYISFGKEKREVDKVVFKVAQAVFCGRGVLLGQLSPHFLPSGHLFYCNSLANVQMTEKEKRRNKANDSFCNVIGSPAEFAETVF